MNLVEQPKINAFYFILMFLLLSFSFSGDCVKTNIFAFMWTHVLKKTTNAHFLFRDFTANRSNFCFSFVRIDFRFQFFFFAYFVWKFNRFHQIKTNFGNQILSVRCVVYIGIKLPQSICLPRSIVSTDAIQIDSGVNHS